ncbi:TIGR04282 family arsenosugar biosynthesis glycosyltransferase [Christiangramia crocea]|uniref:TIGR04282 family arsenosugar biosynthesis glycosyltransferase n=1 Tax=Christiangramia crocea TaxID=2904124 RepID=A0A9X1UUG2_9FLAO|nr:TIGR04282 family arsenosugar biosynthesis glycosyltransferase [Gramella crocea]
MNKENLLIIFTKNPVRGKVKTRLAKDLGEENALEIYKFLLKHSFDITVSLEVTKQVYYSDEIPEKDMWNDGNFIKKQQKGNDLGERMENAFKDGFADGFQRIVIIGTDLIELKTDDIKEAFRHLYDNDYVVGPAEDGGYYLLGMNSLNSEIFKNKEWSTSGVLRDTLKDMEGSKIKLLRTQNDIDVPGDIEAHPVFQKIIEYERQN